MNENIEYLMKANKEIDNLVINHQRHLRKYFTCVNMIKDGKVASITKTDLQTYYFIKDKLRLINIYTSAITTNLKQLLNQIYEISNTHYIQANKVEFIEKVCELYENDALSFIIMQNNNRFAKVDRISNMEYLTRVESLFLEIYAMNAVNNQYKRPSMF